MRFVVEKVRHERSQNTDLRCHFTIRNKHVTDLADTSKERVFEESKPTEIEPLKTR